jgi:threonine/homoserine/homoserine lactone efflux protein
MVTLPNPLIVPVGIAIGLMIAVPIGPVNILCIQRVISRGVLAGIVVGLGAVLADGLIALAAAFSVRAITGWITTYGVAIQIIGGAVLIGLGLRLCLAGNVSVREANGDSDGPSLARTALDIPKAFLLTVTNPAAVLGLVAIFSGVSSFVEVRTKLEALAMVGAIMTGSLAWWVVLSSGVGWLRNKVSDQRLGQVNLAAGLLLVAFGVVLAGEVLVRAGAPA